MASRQWLLVVLELFPNLVFLVWESKHSSNISAIISYMLYNFSAPFVFSNFRYYLRMANIKSWDVAGLVARWDRPLQPGNLETAFRSGDRCKRHGSSNSIQCLGRMDQQVRMGQGGPVFGKSTKTVNLIGCNPESVL